MQCLLCGFHMLNCLTTADRRSEDVGIMPIVIPELKLRNIERQILFADFVECPDTSALNQRPKALDRIGVDRADNIFALGVVNNSVRIFFSEMFVTDPLIGNQQTNLVRNGFLREAFEGRSADILDNRSDHIALTFHRADDNGFARVDATSPIAAAALVDVSIAGFAANESLINLDNTAKLFNVLDKGGSDLVAHQPSGFVGAKTHVTHDLQRAHSLFADERRGTSPEVAYWCSRRSFRRCEKTDSWSVERNCNIANATNGPSIGGLPRHTGDSERLSANGDRRDKRSKHLRRGTSARIERR